MADLDSRVWLVRKNTSSVIEKRWLFSGVPSELYYSPLHPQFVAVMAQCGSFYGITITLT